MANLEKSKELLLRLKKVQEKLRKKIETCKEAERGPLKQKSNQISKRVVQIQSHLKRLVKTRMEAKLREQMVVSRGRQPAR